MLQEFRQLNLAHTRGEGGGLNSNFGFFSLRMVPPNVFLQGKK